MAPTASPRSRAFTRALLASTALVGVGLVSVRAEPLPTGGQVVSGGIAIGTPQGGALAIHQSSQTAIVNWQGFSVGRGNRVDIHQPNAGAAILNRVTGATPSTIAGQLNANGQVYLVNPNGVTITRSGQVNAAGFVASSLGITDEDFKAGRRQFRGAGASAAVTNHGAITIGRGGYAALIGGQVTNTGTIAVPMGRVGLGSGERATLDLSGDGFLQVAVPTGAKGRGALVRHSGTISADGGSVQISAAAARDMARQAVNLSGVVEARSVSGKNGRITLSGDEGAVRVAPNARLDTSGLGGADGGQVRITGGRLDVAGTVDVSGGAGGRVRLRASEHLALSGSVRAEGRAGKGGRVVATAPVITTNAVLIDASGATGGGTVRVGGGRLGQGPLARAERVTVDAGSTIRADATAKGAGGDVVVWSDAATRFAGTITARGGAQGGDGGEVEVSSKGVLAYDGRTILTAARGRFGTLLLDPYNITIANAADSGTTGGAGGFTASANDSVLGVATLQTALANANVTVSTGAAGSAGSQAGTITLAAGAPLAWNSGATLTLQAAGAVTLNSAITAPAGGLRIEAGASAPSTATADLAVARFTLASGDWVQNSATLPGFAAGDFQVTGDSFLRVAGGNGTTASPYRLADIYGLQGMGTSAAYRAANYRLAADIDASGTAAWNGGAGFSPVGTDGAALTGGATFTGSLDGAGRTITGLTIARPNQNYVGLIGSLGTGGRVSSLGLVGGSVSGASFVGGLIGFNTGTVSQSYAGGSVSGAMNVGGLVGHSRGTVSQSYASGSVSGIGGAVGGLVGFNSGNVSQSYAGGSVSGTNNYVGGLIGQNRGAVSQSYASGSVSGGRFVGGFVGLSDGGTLTNAYWDTQTTGQANGVGSVSGSGSAAGATGLTTAQARTASNYTGFDFGSVWYQAGDMRPILRSEAAPPGADGVIAVSNLNQLQLMGANLAGLYRLTRDLDASATNATAASPGVWGAGGFVPVGTDSAPFAGSLDGAGRTITGLTIARPGQDYVGLIGYLGPGRDVSGLGLVGGSVSGSFAVGGLVGYNDGATVSQSYTSGSVTGAIAVGGLVGYNVGAVSQSYANGSVMGGSDVGGLVGISHGPVSQSYASGRVTGGNDVGGLVGYSHNTVSQSYASGRVTGTNNFAGGLVGYNDGPVSESYASGSVTGRISVGGLVGYSDTTPTNAYWDTQTTGRANGVGGGSATTGGTGLTTAQARTASSYAGFDLGSVWYQAGDMRPILRAEAATADAGGVIAVSNLNQLQLMGANLAGRYRLTRDLDASATNATATSSGVWGAGGFVPVGTDSDRFTGGVDGAGRTISGLIINRPGQNDVGLIGYLNGGTVTGLGLLSGNVTGRDNVGGLIGYSSEGRVSQVYATGTVSGRSHVGGLVGALNGGNVNQAYAAGTITGSSTEVGGLVGYNYFGSISQVYATGAVSGSSGVGGLVGYITGGVSQAYATGAVSGSSGVGGLVGYNDGSLPANTYWNIQTSGRTNAVGIGSAGGATGRTTAQMQDFASFQTNYAGFDFATVWAPPNQAGQGGQGTASYPQLYSLSNVVAVTPSSSRVYGAGQGPIATYAGVRPGDFVTTLGSLTTSATATSDVGGYAVTASGTALTSPAGNVYRIVSLPGTLSITPATITVAGVTGLDKTYDRSAALPGGSPGFTSSGVLFGDAITVSAGSALYDSARAGTRAVNVTGLTLGGAKAGNYVLSATAVTGSGTIGRAALSLDGLSAFDKTYDGTTRATLGGTATVSPFTGDVVGVSGSGTGTFADKNVGANKPVAVTGYGLTGADAGNYTLVTPTNLSAEIIKANLSVSGVRPADKTYDGSTAAVLTGTASVNAFGTDVVSLSGTGNATFADKNAGSNKLVVVTGYGLTGADAGNYNIVQPSGLTANIARADLVLTGLSAPGKTYDGTTAATLAGTASVSPIGADAVSLTGTATGTFASKNVGRRIAVSLSGLGLTGLDAGNYSLVAPALSADITPAMLTYTATLASRSYGAANPALSGTVSGFAPGESLGSATTGTLAFGTAAGTSSNAGAYAITGGGLAANNGNYVFVQAPGNAGALTVDPALVNVTGTRTYDATTGFANGHLSVAGGRNGESLTLTRGRGTATSADVGAFAGSALADLTLQVAGGNALASNYRLPATGILTITPAPISVTANGGRSTYGEAPANPGLSVTGLQGGQDAGVLTGLSNGFGIAATTGVGRYGLAVVGALSNGNYTVTGRTDGAWQVDPRPLTLTATAQTRAYGDANPALTYTVGDRGLVNGDGLTGGLIAAADATSPVGTYAIDRGTLAASANYTVTYAGNTLTVNPRPVTVTADAQGRAYGDANPALTYRTTALGAGAALSGALATAAMATSDVGTYDITQGTLTGAANPNYALTYRGADLSVTSRPLTITAEAQTRLYGDADPSLTYRIGGRGLVNGDSLTGALVTAAAVGSGVGTYAIGLGTLAASANYAVTYQSADLTVTQRPAILSGTRVYDAGTGIAGGLLMVGNRVDGDTVTVAGIGTLAGPDVGFQTLRDISGLALSNANYTLAGAGGAVTITPATLTYTADAMSRTYGGANPALTGRVTGFLGADTQANAATGTLAFTTDAGAGSHVGRYAVIGAGLSSGNYVLVQADGNATALAVDPALLTIAGTRTYDATTGFRASQLAVSGGVNGETVTLIAGSGSTASADAGTYDGSSLTGLSLAIGGGNGSPANYRLPATGRLAITPAPVIVTARSGSSVYGDTPVDPGLSANGLVGGQDASVLTGLSNSFGVSARTGVAEGPVVLSVAGTLTNRNYTVTAREAGAWTVTPRPLVVTPDALTRAYGDATPARGSASGSLVNGDRIGDVALLTPATAASDVGRYALTAGDARFAAGDAANYAIAYATHGEGLSVVPRAVTVTAHAQARIYGDTNPTLTYNTTNLGAGAALVGSLATTATASSDVGSYAIEGGTLTAANPNYAVSYRGANLAVSARPITVTAQAQARNYGDANPGLTYTVGGSGLVAGDGLSGALATAVASGSGVGRYGITQGTLAASANYALTYRDADLRVTPRPVILSGTRVYDAGTGIVGGLLSLENRVNGDAVSIFGTGILAGRDVGTQALVELSGLRLSDANYTLTGASGAVAITPATLTYEADAARRTYGAANPALTGTVTGFLGTDTLASATTGTIRFTTASGTGSNVGAYAVTGAGLSAGNYVLVQASGNAAALTVDPAGLTVTGARTYDAATGFHVGQLTVSGGANGETLMLTAGSGATVSADAGRYAGASLTGLSLSVAGGNGSAANYRLPATGTLTITPATVTVRANDGRSIYGDAPTNPGLSATGLVGGQGVGELTGLSSSLSLDATSAAGDYRLTVTGRLTNGNYRVGTSEGGTYTIDRRPITVTADQLTRVYGDADPALIYTVGGRGLVNGDRLTGALATSAEGRSGVGTYAIGQGTLAASADYALTYRGADLAVTGRPITVLADPQTRHAGAANPSLTYTVGGRGLVAGDRLTGVLATTAEAESEPGRYSITRGSLTASANYALGFVGANLTVLAAPTKPQSLPVGLDASRLASTAERAAHRDSRPAVQNLPLLLDAGPDGAFVAADPRFGATLVCAASQGGCFLTPLPPVPMPAAIPAPRPQASLPAAPHRPRTGLLPYR